MALNLHPLLLTILVSPVVFPFSEAYRPVEAGRNPINVNDPHVIEIAKFAMSWRNAVSTTGFQFLKVIKGERQVAPRVTGVNYNLVILAKAADAPLYCEVAVFDREWENLRILTSFREIPAGDALAPALAPAGSW
ncbi:cysteine proteinase inhibitor 5-like [Coffea arabica]|uniref:Cysteine proteinase inhibitor 5-like n=1 Tax=Coffea arabica TaxID=13443 RepID=A0ABM4WM45_COFAR